MRQVIIALLISRSVRERSSLFCSASCACFRSVTSRETASSRSGLPPDSGMGLTTTSHHLGVLVILVAKYPMKRPVPPFRADSTAVCAASRSSPSQKSNQELFTNGPNPQISSCCMPPSFMDRRRPSKSSTLMQSRLQAIKRRLKSSLWRSASCACFRSLMSSESAIMNRGTLSVPGTRETLLLTQIKLPSLRRYCFSI